MTLLIAGTRWLKVTNYDIANYLKKHELNPEVIVSGGARGIDECAKTFAFGQGIFFKEFPADWDKHGLAAGPIRNEHMAICADALLLIWDGQSRGSADIKKRMLTKNKPVYEVILGAK